MQFIIKTQSTFENVYYINAPSRDDAIQQVMNEQNPPDFYQKHSGERIISAEPTTLNECQSNNKCREEGYL
jgi:hypothetical protein